MSRLLFPRPGPTPPDDRAALASYRLEARDIRDPVTR